MIFFVESPLTGTGLSTLAWAVRHGLDVALVTANPSLYEGAAGAEVLAELRARGRLMVVPTTEGTAIPSVALDAAREPDDRGHGVICMTDRHLVFAAALASAVGAPFAPVETVRTFRDKRRARALYTKLGIASPRWAAPRTGKEARAFAADVGAPVLVKNCHGTGSLDVRLCRTPQEAADTFVGMVASDRYLDGDLMIEEFVRGSLYSLETVVTDGRCVHLGVTDRQLGPRPAFCEVSYTFPVAVPQRSEDRMRKTVEALVDETKIERGMLHTEFIMTPDEEVLVELNPRMGGGLLAPMMSDCLTVPVPELLCRAALGQRVAPPAHNGRHSSTITVYAPRAGRLSEVRGLDEADRGTHVVQLVRTAASGDEVRTPGDYRGAVCQLRTVADSANLAFNAALAAARDVVVEVTP